MSVLRKKRPGGRGHRRRLRQRLRLRSVFQEASFHISATLEELADWIRVGR